MYYVYTAKFVIQIVLFTFGAMLMMPLMMVFPEQFSNAIRNFANKKVDELESNNVISKEESDELKIKF